MAWFTEFRADNEADPFMICFFSTLNYRLADGSTLGIEQEAAWCEQCRSFRVVEIVPTIEDLFGRIEDLKTAMKTPTHKLRIIFRTEYSVHGAFDEAQCRLKWRRSRVSPARCLACGLTDIQPVRFDEARSCVVNGKWLVEVGRGFADTADWIAEYSPEGITLSAKGGPWPG